MTTATINMTVNVINGETGGTTSAAGADLERIASRADDARGDEDKVLMSFLTTRENRQAMKEFARGHGMTVTSLIHESIEFRMALDEPSGRAALKAWTCATCQEC